VLNQQNAGLAGVRVTGDIMKAHRALLLLVIAAIPFMSCTLIGAVSGSGNVVTEFDR